jgi:hypothetical protein
LIIWSSDGGDAFTRASNVLAWVIALPDADPKQHKGRGQLFSSLPSAHLMLIVRTAVGGGVRLAYSDALKLVLVEFSALRLTVPHSFWRYHASLLTLI